MAKGNYANCKKITLKWEGGTVDHPDDPGGFTHAGVTAKAGAAYRHRKGLVPKRVDQWTASEIDAFYRDDYWNSVAGEKLPHGVDLATFDFGVNSGPGRAARALQGVVGTARDGRIGPATLNAVSDESPPAIIKKLCAGRLSFVQGLSTFKTFGRGWSRRIADIEARAVAMSYAALVGKVTDRGAEALGREAEAADSKAGAQNKGAGSTVAVGGGGAGAETMAGDGNLWIIAAVIGVSVLVAIVLTLKARQNRDRAEAYRKVAETGLALDLIAAK